MKTSKFSKSQIVALLKQQEAGLKMAIQFDNDPAQFQFEILLMLLDQADGVVATVKDRLNRLAQHHPAIALLSTVPGVGVRISEAVLAYIDDLKRFARINRVAWNGLYRLLPFCVSNTAFKRSQTRSNARDCESQLNR